MKNNHDLLPAALQSNRLYDGKIWRRKDLIDHLILEKGFIIKQVVSRKKDSAYRLSTPFGEKITFAAKAEKKYIDRILNQVNKGGEVELEHKQSIEKIKKKGVKTKDAAKLIAADHIAEDKNYYDKLGEAKLEQGGTIQQLLKGKILEGPSHDNGGIEIQVNNKPVAEAEGGEVVINKKSSKLFCEELSEINQKGGGKAFDCNTCEHNQTCEHSKVMQKGGKLYSDKTQTQSIIFDKNSYTISEAENWLKSRNYSNTTMVDEKENTYRFRQQSPSDFDEKSFRTITLQPGIQAVIGHHIMQDGGKIDLPIDLDIDEMKFGGKIKTNTNMNKQKYNIGDEVIYKDVYGDYTLKSTIASILPSNTINGQPYTEYTLEAGGAYTEDELKPAMAKGGKISDPLSGADVTRQIKKELNKAFPGIKFSVKYDSYSGGDAARISWNFGPTTDMVDDIVKKYQYGSFNSMEDIYEFNKGQSFYIDDEGNKKTIGGVKYVQTSRDFTLNDGKTGNEQYNSQTSIQFLIAKELAKINNVKWEGEYTKLFENDYQKATNYARAILSANVFYTDNVKTFNGLISTGISSGQIESLYSIKYNDSETTLNKKAFPEESKFEKIVAEIPEKDFEEMKKNTYFSNLDALQPIGPNKYYLLMDYYVNNRINYSLLPMSIHEKLDELFYETQSSAEGYVWNDEQLISKRKKEYREDIYKKYPHKLILEFYDQMSKAKYGTATQQWIDKELINPGIQLYDEIMDKYPNAITTAQEEAANYNLFEEFADETDKNDLRNIDFPQFLKNATQTDIKFKVHLMVLENPSKYTEQENKEAKEYLQSLEKEYAKVIRSAINDMYYDKKISECQMSYNRVREIITSANIAMPKHYKLLSETSCRSKKQSQLVKNAARAEQNKKAINAKIAEQKQREEELKALKTKTKQAVKKTKSEEISLKEKQEREQKQAQKVKIAKAKAAAQQQRIRILAMNETKSDTKKATTKKEYRILKSDQKYLNAGTGKDSWFSLEEARNLVNRENGDKIIWSDGMNNLGEVF